MRAYELSEAELRALSAAVKNVPKNVIAFKTSEKQPEKALKWHRFPVPSGFVYVLFFDGHLIE